MSDARIFAVDLGASGGKFFSGVFAKDSFHMDEVHRFEHGGIPFFLRDREGRITERTYWDDTWLYENMLRGLRWFRRDIAGSIESIGQNLGLTGIAATALPQLEHRLSHVRMLIHPSLATATAARQVKCSPQQKWIDPAERSELGIPKPVSDLLADIHNGDFT